MTEIESPAPSTPRASRGRLPSPGCLLAVTLVAIVATVGGWFAWRVQRQQERIHYFRQLGGYVGTEPARPVWLHDFVAARLGRERAAGFTEITAVHLSETSVTDADLQRLHYLGNLRVLWLNDTQISDDGLKHVSGLSNLEWIRLEQTQVTDAGLAYLSRLSHLKTLWITNTRVTDAGLLHLTPLSNLEHLVIIFTDVTNRGVEELRSKLPACRIEWVPTQSE
jgi:hypothetical protein